MAENRAQAGAAAASLFVAMQRIVEDRAVPVIEGYHQDFYNLDREILGASFAPGGQYLWLQHPCGTHMGMIGVLPADETGMQNVLKVYEHSYAPERMELHHITVSPDGDARLSKIDFAKGRQLIRDLSSTYTMHGVSMHRKGVPVAEISVRMEEQIRPNRGYYVHIQSVAPLNRLDAYAASMHAHQQVVRKSDCFARSLGVLVNGQPMDELYPVIQIPPVTRGTYAPGMAAAVQESAPQERQRA